MGYFNFNNQRIFYEIMGDGKPLVLQHGYMQWGNDWHYAGWVKHLEKRHKLIIIDSIGHGRSTASEDVRDYTIEQGVDLIIGLMDSLRIIKFDFFGFSMGGRVGFQIASDYSHRIDRLIIGGMHPRPPIKYRKQINFEEDANLVYEKTTVFKHPRQSYNIDALKLCDDAQIKWKGIESKLGIISNRILLFSGDRDPYFEWVKDASLKLRNSSFVNLKGVGHVGSFYRINRSINLIIKFLRDKMR